MVLQCILWGLLCIWIRQYEKNTIWVKSQLNILNTHKLLIVWCQNGSSYWMLLVRSQYCSIFPINSSEDLMTKALINPQKMQLWERLLMPWKTLLKFQDDLVKLKKWAKINRASTQVFQPQNSRNPQTEIKTILPAKHPGGKASQLLLSLPSPIMKRLSRQMSWSVSTRGLILLPTASQLLPPAPCNEGRGMMDLMWLVEPTLVNLDFGTPP